MRWRAVPHQHKALIFWGVLFGELIEKQLHTVGVQSRQDEPEDAPRSWMSCRIQPEPFVALINFSDGSLSNGRPHPAKYRLETEASFVLAPDFYFVRRVCLLKSLRLKFYLFLNSACSSSVARRLFAGRGT